MRFGIDLGGTKIEIVALGDRGEELLRRRTATPQNSYDGVVGAIAELVFAAEDKIGRRGTVGVAIPGAISRKTGLVKNANTTALIGHPLDRDLSRALHRDVRVENDANCFVLSEATDGAGAGHDVVFGIIAGTGIGGGLTIGTKLISGAHGIAGEWGHNPLPWPTPDETGSARACYCGKQGCIETWCSGPAIAAHYRARTGRTLTSAEIAEMAEAGDESCRDAMAAFHDRFARAIATIVNIVDPDVFVLGGGLSNVEALYDALPPRIERYAFTPENPPKILKNLHGDSSGVRGAAWLWREDEVPAGLPK